MNLLSCSPGTWSPFQDPTVNYVELLQTMKERIQYEQHHVELFANEYELSDKHCKRILEAHFGDIEGALNTWHAWVKWRHDNKIEEITDEEIKHELSEGIFAWRGKNKLNMLCCIITARCLNPIERKGTFKSFKKIVTYNLKKHILKTVDDGMKAADQTDDENHICIIYDRRGMTFDNIDPNLYQFCKKVIDEMRLWYANRIGIIYVLHANVFFWMLYWLIVKPFLGLFENGRKIIVVETPEELLEHFDEEQLFLLSYQENPPLAPDSKDIEGGLNDDPSQASSSTMESEGSSNPVLHQPQLGNNIVR